MRLISVTLRGLHGVLIVLWQHHRIRFGSQSDSQKLFLAPCPPNQACGFSTLDLQVEHATRTHSTYVRVVLLTTHAETRSVREQPLDGISPGLHSSNYAVQHRDYEKCKYGSTG